MAATLLTITVDGTEYELPKAQVDEIHRILKTGQVVDAKQVETPAAKPKTAPDKPAPIRVGGEKVYGKEGERLAREAQEKRAEDKEKITMPSAAAAANPEQPKVADTPPVADTGAGNDASAGDGSE